MSNPLSILFTASEIYPFAKTGGVADVAYGLPLALRDLGHDIRVMLPKYGCISERKNRIHEINRLKDLPIAIGDNEEPATVKSSSITNPKTKVQAYMTTNYRYFDSKWGLYADPDTGEAYADNDERFIFFCKTVMETCSILEWVPDIVHCNDWHTALIAAYMRETYKELFAKTKIVFTVHSFSPNSEYSLKPTFYKTQLPSASLPNLEHRSKCNFMKAGLIYADAITTVSPTYAQELLSDSTRSNGLNELLNERKDVFRPILNGIDSTVWNPAKDKLIARRYSSDSIEDKDDNKEALLEKFGFDDYEGEPVVAILSRLVEQKGIALIEQAAEQLLSLDIKLVVLGEGEERFERFFKRLADSNPSKVAVHIGFDDPLAHLIEAGADILLMPSLYEPCGLNQMYSFTYGTIPVVHATGGLADTVRDYAEADGKGNGFAFRTFTVDAMMDALKRALELYENHDAWRELQMRGMNEDHSWERSAKLYEELYRDVLSS